MEGACAGPYSSVALLFGLEETMMLTATDPDLVHEACEFFVELQTRYIEAQLEAGAHAVWLGDCNAFSGFFSPEQYRKFAFPSCKKLVEKAQAKGAIVHLMNSEVSLPYLLAEAELGVDIVNCGPGADIAEVRKAFTGKCCFSGNLDPIKVLMRGTPEQVAAEAEWITKIGNSAGEETGKLDYVLDRVSTYYDHEVDTSLKTATSLIEPIMIAAMGFVVGGIGMALMLPIFSLSRQH